MRRTVLVCDDDPEMRAILVSMLSRSCDVLAAGCGEETLALIAKRLPDVVVLDMVLPGLSGLETLEAYQRTNPGLPTLILTGKDDAEAAARALSLGAHAYITKPFEKEVLLDAIGSIFDASSPEDGERPPWRHK